MKKKISLLTILSAFAILLAGALIMSSCEGPQGPAGTDGQDGVDGIDGIDGVDGTATCIQCHDDNQTIVTRTKQYNFSGHATGHTSGYCNRSFGPTYNCAGCHTSQGFLDNLLGESNVPYANVTQPNCYTCHNIHDTYTADDWALTLTDVLMPLAGSDGVDIGKGNQCVACHQATGQYILDETLFGNFDDGGLTSVEITTGEKRAGVHHAPQYNIYVGTDLFEFSGSAEYPDDSHVMKQTAEGCVTCHMHDGFGDLTGHSMAMTYEFHGPQFNWPSACLDCHEDGGDYDLGDVYAAVTGNTSTLLATLYDLLVAAEIMYPMDDANEYLMMPGTFTTDLTAAHVNYNAIREDRSLGFHNPGYVTAILENTIEAISP